MKTFTLRQFNCSVPSLFLTNSKFIFFLIYLFSFTWLQSQTTLYVGTGGGEYSTIASAYAACTGAGTNYIILIQTTYTNTEAKPITFAANVAGSIIIRPNTGVSAFTLGLVVGTETSIISFTGGDNITIDGRIGSTGSTSLITISNTQTAASKYAVQYSGGSTGNTITYCTVKGSNSDAAASATTSGVIVFASGTNSSNTIDHCTVQQAGANYPGVCINSYDATTNNNISVTNCNIVNFTYYGIWANGANNDDWAITGNSFYSDYSQTGWTHSVYMLHIADGKGYTITGNYFGGQAASCAGSAYSLSGTSVNLYPIFVADCDAGTITISGNYIQNIAFTTTLAGTQWTPFFIAAGAADFIIGSSGSHNTIGSTSGTGNITCTDNAAASAAAIQCIVGVIKSTGTSTIEYNDIGGITFNGSNASTKTIYGVYLDKGTLTFSNNTLGNTAAGNISLSPASAHTYLVCVISTCLGTTTVNNNTLQNVTKSGTGNFYGVYANNQLTCSSNTFSKISSSSSSGTHYIIYYDAAENVSITSNTIKAITYSGASSVGYIMYIDAGTGAATIGLTSNTIGEFGTSNDITMAGYGGSGYNYGIFLNDGGNITFSSNILQNFYLSSANVHDFYTIWIDGGCTATNTFSDNSLDNITSLSTETSSVSAIVGFFFFGVTSGTHTFSHNTVTDFSLTSTSASQAAHIEAFYNSSSNGATVTFEKNRISGHSHASTLATTPYIAGMRLNPSSGTNNIYNNVIILNNGGITNALTLYGIYNDASGATYNIYHNTIKLYGTVASGTGPSAAFSTLATTGTFNIKNNIFQNLRTGGSGIHYGIKRSNTTPTWAEDYNYVEAGTIGYWGGTTETSFASWQGVSGTNDKNSTITIAASGVVAAASSSDVKNTGTDMDATVATDIDATTRHATTPYMGAYEGTTALPIELLSFTATPVAQLVELNWTTITETNNNYFTIERSADGIEFTSIAVVKGAGNSNSLINYMNTDIRPLKGISYYRLKQTDYDGQFSYSDIIVVNFSGAGELTVFPNPTGHSVALSFLSALDNKCTVTIFDALGRIVKSENHVTDEEGINNLNIDLSAFNKGIYFITLATTTDVLKAKILKD